MRTTKPQQTKNQRLLIRATVDLMTQRGFDGTTMKQIARAAGLSDATVYNYFPSKERIVLAYFEHAFSDALAATRETPDLADFNLQEQVQLLIDAVLAELQADRAFVGIARQLVERTPILLLSAELPGKAILTSAFAEYLTQAEAKGEMSPCGFKPSLSGLLADYVYGIISYWLRDESDELGNTTQLVDLSLGVLVLALQSGLIDRLLALGGFVIRSQLARLIQNGNGLIDLLQLIRGGMARGGASAGAGGSAT